MVESSEIQQLREDIQELRLLYRRLAETLLPEEEPTPEEKAALDDESKEYFSESEFLRMLQGNVRRSSKRSASRVRMAERGEVLEFGGVDEVRKMRKLQRLSTLKRFIPSFCNLGA
jgi:hypothetical protein